MVEGRIFDEKTNKTIKKRPKSPAYNVSPHTSITPKRGEIPPKHPKSATAVTLVEVALATLLMVVGFMGATSYRYYAALDEQRATLWRSAARIGLLFSDSWRGLKGSETYDPLAHVRLRPRYQADPRKRSTRWFQPERNLRHCNRQTSLFRNAVMETG